MIIKTLGEVAKYINGRAFKPAEWESSGVPIIRIQNLNDLKAKYNYSTSSYDEKFLVRNGDLLFAWSASLGAYIWKGNTAWLNQHIFRVIPNDCINKMYLYYFLCQVVSELYAKAHGSGMVHITKTSFMSTPIPLPSIPEQERIISRIEELFSELDKAVETLNTIKQQLAVYRQAVLKEAFIGEYPKDKLENVCFFITKGTTPKKTELMSEGEIPFIKVYNLTFDISLDFTIEPTFVSKEVHTGFLSRSIVYPGDVLMNIVGPPMGKVSIVPDIFSEWNINQAIVRFRCNENLYNKYLAYFLGFSETVEKMKSKAKATAGHFNLTLEICRNIEIPLPSIEIQKQIVNSIEVKLSVCDQIEKTIEQSLQQAEAMRQSILKQAFEGRLI